MITVKTIDETAREAVLSTIRNDPSKVSLATLLELSQTEQGNFLVRMTIADLASGASSKKAATAPKKTKKTTKSSDNEVNTKSPKGRKRFRNSVLKVLKKNKSEEGLSIGDIQAKTGGTILQVRTALNYWINDGALTKSGKTRKTRYALSA